MVYRHQFPVVRVLLPFVAGIALIMIAGPSRMFPAAVVALWALMLFYVIFSKQLWAYPSRWLFGAVASAFMFILGCQLTVLNDESRSPDYFSQVKGVKLFLAEVAEPLTEKEHSYKTVLRIKGAVTEKGEIRCSGKILIYFRKDSTAKYPSFGETILWTGDITEIESPKNPGAFNYKKYMASANVFHQAFLKPGQWYITTAPVKWSFRGQAQGIRNYFLEILKKNGFTGQEYAVAAALILGQEDDLDAETMRNYAGAGVMHILSVSGLHVGIVYMVLNFLLGFLNRKRTTVVIKTLILITAIWFYALITGFSPSIARSATMFTFVSVAVLFRRNSHVINSLAASALLLLAFNPYYLLNIGFQLSYISLAGIIFIYDWIYHRIEPVTRVGDQIWQIVAISLAAQIATIPVSLYYFHQFPSYFLAANIVAIPLSSLVIYSGMLVMATSFMPAVSNFMGIISTWLLKFLNGSIAWIESLPYAVISGIPFSINEMLILYAAIILMILAVAVRRKGVFIMALSGLIIFFGYRSVMNYMAGEQRKFIVYSAGKSSVMEWICGTESYVVADSLFLLDASRKDMILNRSNTLLRIRKVTCISQAGNEGSLRQAGPAAVSFGNKFLVNNKRVALLNNIPADAEAPQQLRLDYLVISGNTPFRLSDVLKLYDPGKIILDGSVPYKKSLQWLADARQAGILIHSVRQQGAFIEDI